MPRAAFILGSPKPEGCWYLKRPTTPENYNYVKTSYRFTFYRRISPPYPWHPLGKGFRHNYVIDA
jgi:hypothetical protein